MEGEMMEDMKESFEESERRSFEEMERYREELKAEFMKVVNEHPEAIANFQDYYKYLFTFTTEIDGKRWAFSVGGHADEIYKFNVQPIMLVKEILNVLDLEDVLK